MASCQCRLITTNIIYYLILCFLCFGAFQTEASAANFKNKSEIKKNTVGNNIIIQPQLNKLITGFIECNGEEIYFVKSISKLFFQDLEVNATIDDIEFKGASISIDLSSRNFRSGKVVYVFRKDLKTRLDSKTFNCFVDKSLASKNIRKVYLDTKTNKYHIYNNNHYTSNLITEKEARALGAEKDNLCFIKKLYIPDYNLEQRLAREGILSVIHIPSISNDSKEQKRLSKIGSTVLANWPLEKIGYEYKFTMLDSKSTQAFAIAGGGVYVTRGLYDSLENEAELQAILAHEIAHVEKRHALQSLKVYIEKLKASAAMAAFAQAAAASNNNNVAIILAAGAVVNALYQGGYPKEQEREADFLAALYFKKNNLDERHVHSVFRKLQFVNLTTVFDPDPKSTTHPLLEERINYVKLDKFKILDDIKFKSDKKNIKNLTIKPIYSVDMGDEYYLYLYFNDRSLHDKYLKGHASQELEFSIAFGSKTIRLSGLPGIYTSDDFGVYRMFVLKKSSGFDISEMKKISVLPKNYGGVQKSFYFKRE